MKITLVGFIFRNYLKKKRLSRLTMIN